MRPKTSDHTCVATVEDISQRVLRRRVGNPESHDGRFCESQRCLHWFGNSNYPRFVRSPREFVSRHNRDAVNPAKPVCEAFLVAE
jgi:hypothetical protein